MQCLIVIQIVSWFYQITSIYGIWNYRLVSNESSLLWIDANKLVNIEFDEFKLELTSECGLVIYNLVSVYTYYNIVSKNNIWKCVQIAHQASMNIYFGNKISIN